MSTYVAKRDGRFTYSHQAVEHIEQGNCAKGCRFGAAPGSHDYEEFGPGGVCPVLALVAAGCGDEVVELEDDGENITCRIRTPPNTSGGTIPLTLA